LTSWSFEQHDRSITEQRLELFAVVKKRRFPFVVATASQTMPIKVNVRLENYGRAIAELGDPAISTNGLLPRKVP
jgi:hypothetical protein